MKTKKDEVKLFKVNYGKNSKVVVLLQPIICTFTNFINNIFGKKVKDSVIDASITGVTCFEDVITKIINSGSKITFTQITIDELDRLKNSSDKQAADSRYLLTLGSEQPEKCKFVRIDDTLNTADDCIVKYCADNKDHTVLFTSDKHMALDARTFGIRVKYIKQPLINSNKKQGGIQTLFQARRVGNNLQIYKFITNDKKVRVISDGIEYNCGNINLKVGDDVFIAKKFTDNILFLHYKIVSLYATNNSELIYSRRIYHNFDLTHLPKATYKTFIKDFKYEFDL